MNDNEMSRVDKFLPMLQFVVCFLRLSPDYPVVPQYFNHTAVGPDAGEKTAVIGVPTPSKRSVRIFSTMLFGI
jgi:hypothetical protein